MAALRAEAAPAAILWRYKWYTSPTLSVLLLLLLLLLLLRLRLPPPPPPPVWALVRHLA